MDAVKVSPCSLVVAEHRRLPMADVAGVASVPLVSLLCPTGSN
jgi:hypothetical protein